MNTIGPISRVISTRGRKPKLPASMGRNRIPPPTAVPNRVIAHDRVPPSGAAPERFSSTCRLSAAVRCSRLNSLPAVAKGARYFISAMGHKDFKTHCFAAKNAGHALSSRCDRHECRNGYDRASTCASAPSGESFANDAAPRLSSPNHARTASMKPFMARLLSLPGKVVNLPFTFR